MTDNYMNMDSLAKKLQDLELLLKSQHGQEVGYGKALREAIASMDCFMEVEVLKSLGDLHLLQKGKHSKDSAEFDKAAVLYAAALLRCTDPDMEQTLEHRIGYLEKLSRQLLQGYTPQYQSQDYRGTRNNVLRVAEICDKLDRRVGKLWQSMEETYTETLVTAITNGDVMLEVAALKSLGDLYLKKSSWKKTSGSDVTQLSRAAAMYSKALARCEDPETRQTLEHRVLYLVKIWGSRRIRLCRKSKPKQREQGVDTGHKSRTNTRPADEHNELLQPDMSSQSDRLKEGESSLARADLDSAEKHFAAALKMVHVRDPTAQQYQREVEPLCKLGDVYRKRGQQTGDGGDFVKAAALYIAAIARSEDQVLNGDIELAIKKVEKSFLRCILGIPCNIEQENTEKHKEQLKEMRDQIKLEMETIDQQLDPYVHDEDDPHVREIEAKRAQGVRQLFERIAQERKEFISQLVEESIGLMGSPPCKYALIGLGSQATGLVTPYSDLEFAILVEKEREPCLSYFRNLTHYLHLKVVNLGETILPALGIKSLNDFYSENPLDSWYYDSVTPRGFAFDGSMPEASKTPLGRQETVNEPPSELICTPSNMISILQKDTTLYLKEGYHLGSILRNPCLIAGDQGLIEMYKTLTANTLQEDGGKMAKQMALETLIENITRKSDELTMTSRLIDVKKELYRFPAVAVDCLALASCIIPTTVWKTIEEMENQQVISPSNAHHLTVLTSISAELRLRTYIANGGQKENLSALASMETVINSQESSFQTNYKLKTNVVKPVFHLPNEKQLFRYYFTAVPLRIALSLYEFGKKSGLHDLYDNSPRVRGMMYSALCKYSLAIEQYHEALGAGTDAGTDFDKMQAFYDLGDAYMYSGDYQKAIDYLEQALQIQRSIDDCRSPVNASSLLNSLGMAYNYGMGDYRKAVSYLKQSLHMARNVDGQSTENNNNSIATTCNNLGEAFRFLGDYKKAIDYYEEALLIKRGIYGQNTPHQEIAKLHNNLGLAWGSLGDYRKAVRYFEQALKMDRSIYGQTTVHPEIATLLVNLGGAWGELNEKKKEISYSEQSLLMFRSIHGVGTAHPAIATLLNNLGEAGRNLGDLRKALRYHEQALEMRKSIYGQTSKHPDIAVSLNNVGVVWGLRRDHRKAISYYEKALEMNRSVYGESASHPDIAGSMSNLAEAWRKLGDLTKALCYYEQALEMRKSIYGLTKHHDIAESLNSVGVVWSDLGDHRKAKSYYEKALEMYKSVYGHNTAHPQTANLLMNIAIALSFLGYKRKAITTCKEALSMARQVYPQDHPKIKEIKLAMMNFSRK
ncbi:uncharacterized protein [Branchiostoma lanceolatum]|uniref:uncharacterized protein n=1 Tax=Branchiostoma lanceolatum TaxID=7740 RepID=UPI003453AA03